MIILKEDLCLLIGRIYDNVLMFKIQELNKLDQPFNLFCLRNPFILHQLYQKL